MSKQCLPGIRFLNAIDLDLMDAKKTISLIEKLIAQSNQPNTSVFSKKELQTLIRNCIHSIILNLTKTIEKPKEKIGNESVKLGTRKYREIELQTYNLKALIDYTCHDDDLNALTEEYDKIKGNNIYGKLVDYRHSIIAHRNIEYQNYQAIEQKFAECKDFLIKNRDKINSLIDKIHDLQMDIKASRNKKLGLRGDGDVLMLNVRESKG